MGPNGGQGNAAATSDAHDSNTDHIHLTTAFPKPSTSSNVLSFDQQVSLLPPVVNPSQIISQQFVNEAVVNPTNGNNIGGNGNIDSLTGE